MRLDEETGTATVIVSDFQLSLAIGKEGQNARLAARLTGWRIDIKSETQLAEEEAGYGDEEWAEGEWVEDERGEMVWQPAEGGEAMSAEEWSHAAEDTGEAGTPPRPRRPQARPAGARDRARGAPRQPAADGARGGARGRAGRGGRGARGGRDITPTRTCVGCRKARRPTSWSGSCGGPGGMLSVDRQGTGARGVAVPGIARLPATRRCAGTPSTGPSQRRTDVADGEQLRAQAG